MQIRRLINRIITLCYSVNNIHQLDVNTLLSCKCASLNECAKRTQSNSNLYALVIAVSNEIIFEVLEYSIFFIQMEKH